MSRTLTERPRLRIAQVAPLYESVPPRLYGGTERVVAYLTEELVRLGHDVTLFASGDSRTSARLVPIGDRAIRLDGGAPDPIARHLLELEAVFQQAKEGRFDLVHFHVDALAYPLARRMATPHVSTLHGRLDLPDLVPLYAEFSEMPVVSISLAQRRPLPRLNWQATVHHGLPPDLYAPGTGGGGYLAFLGRISPEKGLDRAVEISRRAGLPLRVAAKVDPGDAAYFETTIRPLLARSPHVELVGEIGDADKGRFLGEAAALLFPIAWPEPFGLVLIEAMACGTPVIAFRNGSVDEIVEDGENGYRVETIEDAVAALGQIGRVERGRCREVFDERFSSRRMALDYLRVYRRRIATLEARRERRAAASQAEAAGSAAGGSVA